MPELEAQNWWKYSDESVRELVRQSFRLIDQERKRQQEENTFYHDYAFIVFPAAKAYEGFLKSVFLDMKLITPQQYYGDHFRIGRALSPTLPKRYRAGWVFGKLIDSCKGDQLPLEMWEVWKMGRNRLFHFFPHHQECITLEQSVTIVQEITDMMNKVLVGCRVGDVDPA